MEMTWFFLALVTAASVGLRDVLVKHAGARNDAAAIGLLELAWALPLLAAGLALVPVPPLDPTFWLAFFLSLPLNAASYFLYIMALKAGPISLSVPFLACTPLFMIVTGQVVLDELPGPWGVAGIFLVAAGGYLVYLEEAKNGLLAPFRAIFRQRGSRLMLVVAFLFSIGAVLGKQAILHSSPLFFCYLFFTVFNLLTIFTLILSGRSGWNNVLLKQWKTGLVLGLLLNIHVATHALAISMTTAAYMVSVKRASILFAVALGGYLFREDLLAQRLTGAVFMLAGLVAITLAG